MNTRKVQSVAASPLNEEPGAIVALPGDTFGLEPARDSVKKWGSR